MSSNVKAERYLRNQGQDENGHYYDGYIIADPGAYKLIAYNFDTESTIIGAGNNHYYINAYTNEIASHLYTKIPSRSPSRNKENQNAQQAAQGEAEGKAPTDPEGKGPVVESIVYDPDHLFVGRLNDVYIPARSVDAPPVVLDVRCETVVESWILEVKTITGKKNIGTTAAVVTGLAESNRIGPNERSEEFVSVYFDNQVIDEKGVLTGKFNTFGRHDGIYEPQVVSIVFTDIAGKGHVYNFDVSDQMIDNKEQIIRIETDIDIPEPIITGSGGFAPSVDDWGEINTERMAKVLVDEYRSGKLGRLTFEMPEDMV